MAEETWRIILTEDYAPSAAPGAAGAPGGVAPQEPPERRQTWQDIAKIVTGVAGVAGVLAFLIQSMQRSKIYSTFMDNLLMVWGAITDILMIPLIPILMPVLGWFLKLLPVAKEASEAVKEFLKDPWTGMQKIFTGVGGIFEKIGSALGGIWSGIGKEAGDMLKGIGNILGESGRKIWEILTDKGTTFWEKIGAVGKVAWDAIVRIWNDEIMPHMKIIAGDVWDWIQIEAGKKWDEISIWFNEKVIDPLLANWNYLVGDYLPKLWSWFTGSWLPVKFGEFFRSLPGLLWDAITGKRRPEDIGEMPTFSPPGFKSTTKSTNINVTVNSNAPSAYMMGEDVASAISQFVLQGAF